MLPGRTYTPERLIEIAWRSRWVLFWPIVLSVTVAAVYARTLPDIYQATATIAVVPQRVSEQYVRSSVTLPSEARFQAIGLEIMTRDRLERIIRDLQLVPPSVTLTEALVWSVQQQIKIAGTGSDAFYLTFVASDPKVAKAGAERLMALYMDENRRERDLTTTLSSSFLGDQVSDVRRRLKDHEKRLEAYRRVHAGELPEQIESNLSASNNAQLRFTVIHESLSQDVERRNTLEREVSRRANATPDRPTPPVVVGPATEALAEARQQRRDMLGRLKPQHPDVLTIEAVIRDLEPRAREEQMRAQSATTTTTMLTPAVEDDTEDLRESLARVSAQIADKETQIRAIEREIAGYEARIKGIPVRESELAELLRDYDTTQELYRKLVSQHEESNLAANLERNQVAERFRVIDPPRLPEEPFAPSRGLTTIYGLLIGVALGAGLSLLRDLRDSSFRTESEITEVLALPVLAGVPLMLSRSQRRTRLLARAGLWMAAAASTAACGLAVAWTLGAIGGLGDVRTLFRF